MRDSLFQYGWVLPQVFKPVLRRHVCFAAIRREDARDVFAFWQDARRGAVECVAHHNGRLAGGTVEAPIAVYRHDTRGGDRATSCRQGIPNLPPSRNFILRDQDIGRTYALQLIDHAEVHGEHIVITPKQPGGRKECAMLAAIA